MDNFQSTNEQSTREKGKASEKIAEDFLIAKGFKIVKKNFQFGKVGEIDIVAKLKDVLVFVEVKSCTTKLYGNPLFQVTPKKAKQIRKVAEGYLFINKIYNVDCRFDIVTIDFSEKEKKIEHIENAFM